MPLSKPLLIFLCAVLPFCSVAQSVEQQLDSLRQVVTSADDTTRVLARAAIARRMATRQPDESVTLTRQSIADAKQIGYVNGLVHSYALMIELHSVIFYDFDKARVYLDSALALESRTDTFFLRDLYRTLGVHYDLTGELNEAYTWLQKALRLNKGRDDDQAALLFNALGKTAYQLGRHRDAIDHFRTTAALARKIRRWSLAASAASNIAHIFGTEKKYDSALHYFGIVYRIERQHGNPKDNVLLLAGMGTAYNYMDIRDSAYHYLHQARAAAQRVKLSEGFAAIHTALADYHRTTSPDSAIYYAHLSLQGGDKPLHAREQSIKILADAFASRKAYDSSDYYLRQYLTLHDSVLHADRLKQIDELRTRYDVERKEAMIRDLKLEKELNTARQRLLIIAEVGTVLLLAGLFFYYRLIIRNKRRDLRNARHQLKESLASLIRKSDLVEELSRQLEHLRTGYHPNDHLENLENAVRSGILTDEDWQEFKGVFEKVHRGFFQDIVEKFPGLTNAEVRLAALLKLKLSTREIASILGISPDSVGKTRHRLRKKLHLPAEENLDDFITNGYEQHVPGQG